MVILKNQDVVEIFRDVRGFLNLEIGFTRDAVPNRETAQQELGGALERLCEQAQKREQMGQWLKEKDQRITWIQEARTVKRGDAIQPEHIVWIFGTTRVRSTWLAGIMGDLKMHSTCDA